MRRLGLVLTALGANIGSAAAQAGLTIEDLSHSEAGNSGFGQMAFVVRVSRDAAAPGGQVSVQFQGASGTAIVSNGQCGPGIDVVVQASTLTIPANTNQGTIFATVCEDALDESDAESFTITLLSPIGATIQDGLATGTLLDDDPTPSLRVADVTAQEGAGGEQRNLNVSITLSAASGRVVTVNYAVAAATGGNAATGGAGCGGTTDFVTRSGTESFPAGTTTRQVAVTLCGDARFEPDERIAVSLSGPGNASIADGTGVGTIGNDDPQPMITVATPNDGLVTEGTGPAQTVTIQVTLSNANHDGASVTLAWGGSAERGTTCTGAVDILTGGAQVVLNWAAGANDPKLVTYTVCGDNRDEENDTVELNPTAGVVAGVPPGEATNRMVIFDDDQPPAISVPDVTVNEGDDAVIAITLSTASNREITVLLSSESGSGIPPRAGVRLAPATLGASCGGDVDFIKTSHRARIPAGQLTVTTPFRVTTCRNADAGLSRQADPEVFIVKASDPEGATLAKTVGTILIREP